MTRPDENLPDQPAGDDQLSTADLVGRPTDKAAPRSGASDAISDDTEPLVPASEAEDLRARWDAIQAGFVDEPRRAVESADGLVAAAMKRLAETFADERQALEAQWDRGDDVSTEDLRLALRRYRSFFGRLLSI